MIRKQTIEIYYKAVKGLLALILSVACLYISVPPDAHAKEETIPNEFIFEVMLPPTWRISEAVFAYERGGKYYLPINELAAGFNFFIDTEQDRGLATGFAGREENNFTIDHGRKEIIIKNQRSVLNDDAILISEYLATDDLYVQLEVLNQIWPVDMSIDLSALKIIVETEEKLSFMRDKEREEKLEKVVSRKATQEALKKKLPKREHPYQFFGSPVMDFQALYTYDDKEDTLTGSNIFSGVQQLGKMIAQFSANIGMNEDKKLERPESIRFKLSRKSADKDYLVPGIRSIETADVSLRQRNLISNTENGRGLIISNDNRDRFNEFSQITVEGIGPPGWEIELYNNEELLEFSTVPDNGQFFFEDVTLNFGNNQIRILLFGPQGQVREDIRSYTAGGNMLSPGSFIYKAGFLDADREFILLDNAPRTEPRGVVKNLETSYGVNEWLTVFGNYAQLPEQDKDHTYMTAGASISTPIGLVDAEAYNEIGGGNALALDYITKFLGVRSNFGAAFFNDFESQDAGFGNNHKTFEAKAQLNKTFKIATLPLGLRLNTTHTERKSSLTITTIDTAQTLSRAGLRLSHNTSTRLNDYSHERSTGSFTTTWREKDWQLRGTFGYDIYPKFDFGSFNSELRYRPDEKYQGSLTLGHNFQTSDYNAGLQVGYDFDTILGTLESRYQRGEGWDFILRATTSLNPYTPDGRYGFSSDQKREYSPVRAQVFLDKDLDGVFGEGDEPLPDARLRIGTTNSQITADENGMIIANAPADRLTNFQIDPSSLEDPYFIPATNGFSAVPAKGSVIEVSFPIVETGAIEGTVLRGDNDRIVAGLTLELFDENNEKVGKSVSAFDGYYAFEFIKPGRYKIQADPSHKGVRLLDNETTINPDDLFVYGNDLYAQILTLGQNEKPEQKLPYGPFAQDIAPAAGNSAEIFGPFKPEQSPEQKEETKAAKVVQPINEETKKSETQTETTAKLTPPADPVKFTTTVQQARFKAHDGHARLILETNEDIQYEILQSDSPQDIQILINDTLWQPPTSKNISHGGHTYIMSAQQTEAGTLLSISSQQPLSLKRDLVLQNQTSQGARLLLDIN